MPLISGVCHTTQPMGYKENSDDQDRNAFPPQEDQAW